MAKRRYKNIPNRNYIKLQPVSQDETGGKGSYRGKILQETQPKIENIENDKNIKNFRMLGTIAGQVLLGGIAFVFYQLYLSAPDFISGIEEFGKNAKHMENQELYNLGKHFVELINSVFYILILGVFGRLLSNHSHIYWAELIFSSKLLYLSCEGTFNESKLTIGKAFTDSAQTDNVIVKTSNTSLCIASKIYTSTFAGIGSNNLELPRHVLTMEEASVDMNAILDELKYNLDNKKQIASISTEADAQTIEAFNKINSMSGTNLAQNQALENNAKVLPNNSEDNTEEFPTEPATES